MPCIHRLEQVSSEEMVGSLAENLMEALRENPKVEEKVRGLGRGSQATSRGGLGWCGEEKVGPRAGVGWVGVGKRKSGLEPGWAGVLRSFCNICRACR